MNKRNIFLIVVIAQIVIISLLVLYIYKKGTKLSLSFIKKNDIEIKPSGKIKYFWEPKASTMITKNDNDFPQFAKKFTITINSDTLNEIKDYSIPKPPGVFRIITLGDSLTYGLYVNTKDNWTKLLEDKLNTQFDCKKYQKIEVINLGVFAYDPQYEVERYRTRGQKYNPDLVIWFLIENDFNEINEFMLPKVENYTAAALKSGEYENKWKDLGIYFGPAWLKAKSDIINEFGSKGILDYNASMIKSLDNYFKGELLVVSPSQISPEYKKTIKNFVSKRPDSFYFNNLSYITTKDTVFPDYHPNQLGHKLISQDIFNYLIKNKLINCE